MNFSNIVAEALDEWTRDDVVAEDANKSFFTQTAKANINKPKAPKSETAQAQNTAQKPVGQQLFDLAKHDKSKHRGNFDPNTMSCKFRKEMAKSLTAMGLAVPEQVKSQLGEKNIEAAKREGHDLQKNDERIKAIQKMVKERDQLLATNGKESAEYKQSVEDLFKARMDFARQMIGDEEADAGEGLVEVAVDDPDPKKQELANKKVDELFEKAMNGEFNEAQNAELLAIGSKLGKEAECKALEDKLFKPDTGVNQEQLNHNIKENEQNEAIQEQMRAKSAESEPDEPEEPSEPDNTPEEKSDSGITTSENPNVEAADPDKQEDPDRPKARDNNPEGLPNEFHAQVLSDTIGELDSAMSSDELSEYEKDKRRTVIANRAAKYLESWADIDDPAKRQNAVELAIQDVESAEAEGRKIEESEDDVFISNTKTRRKDVENAVTRARENLSKVMADNNATAEEKLEARQALQKAKQEHEKRMAQPTEEDLFEDQESSKRELDDATKGLDDAKTKLAEAEKMLSDAEASGEASAIKDAKKQVESAREAVDAAEQAKNDAQGKYESARESFENYEPAKSAEQETINTTIETMKSDGISEDSINKFKMVESFLREDPTFYKRNPELLENFKKDADAWTRIRTDNPAMQGMLSDLKGVAAEEISAGRMKRAVTASLADDLKSEDPAIVSAAKMAAERIENGDDPVKVHKEYNSEVRKIRDQHRKDELHSVRMQKEMNNAAKAAAQAFAAEQANKAKYRDATVKESQPEIFNAIAQEYEAEKQLGDDADPTKIAQLKNILDVLENDKSVSNIDKAIKDYGKGWSHAAKNKEAVAAIKAQNAKEDNLEKTWAESNVDGKMKDLESAIETLGKRKDDAGKAAAARLTEIRKELGTTHSEKRTEALLKEWSNIVGGRSVKMKKRGFDYDAFEPYESHKGEYEKVDKQTVENDIQKSLPVGKVNAISPAEAAKTKSQLNKVFLTRGIPGVSVMDDDKNAPAGSEKDPRFHGVINGPSFTNYVLNTPDDGSFTEKNARDLIGNIKAALHLPDDRTPMVSNIDGKLVVQVPKEHGKRDVVTFGDMLRTDEWKKAKNGIKNPDGSWKHKPMHLPIIVGQDSLGRPIVKDLSDIKHLLIAGQTGMGKSVGLNTVIASLALARDAGELDLDFIDMKGGEALGRPSKLPQSRGGVAVSSDDAMQRVVDFKQRMDAQASALGGGYDGKQYSSIWEFNEAHPEDPMKPSILIIDEAAALVGADKHVLEPLARIAQEGRAPGFSLVMATQRPDAKTLPSEITGQMPGKMIFKTKNGTESRLLTDDFTSDGANLLGSGDMLFNDGKGFRRVQGAFIDDKASNNEIDKVYSEIEKGHTPKSSSKSTTAE